jgi:hypothetical protein
MTPGPWFLDPEVLIWSPGSGFFVTSFTQMGLSTGTRPAGFSGVLLSALVLIMRRLSVQWSSRQLSESFFFGTLSGLAHTSA